MEKCVFCVEQHNMFTFAKLPNLEAGYAMAPSLSETLKMNSMALERQPQGPEEAEETVEQEVEDHRRSRRSARSSKRTLQGLLALSVVSAPFGDCSCCQW